MAVSDGEHDHRRQGHGPGVQRVRRPHARRAHRPPRPSATPATPPPGRAPGATPSRSTATSATTPFALGHNGNLVNTEELAAEAGHAARHGHQRQRPRGRAARPTSWPSDPEPSAATAGRSSGRCSQVLPRLEGAFSFVLMDEGHVIGVRDPNGFRPLCLGKLDDGWVLASETPGARRRRRPLRPRGRARRDGRHRRHRRAARVRPFAAERHRPQALPVRVRLLRPARRPPLRPERAPGPGPHGRAARRAGAGRGRPGHGRARVRASRPPRASPAPAASPTARAWSRTATSAAPSSPPTRRCGRSACA